MAYVSLARSTPLLLVTALGCSTADGLDTGSGGDTGGQDPGPDEPTPEPDGDACGPEVFGWNTECSFTGTISYQNPLAPDEYLEFAPYDGTKFACCQGAPSTETADSACVDVCIVEMCRIAGNIYRQLANENDWHCTQGCDFNTDACLAGDPVQQFPHPPSGDNFPHEVTVSCEATNVEPRHPDGVFAFIESPENYEYLDPDVCNPSMSAAGLEPLVSLVANTVVEDAGSYALASWWTGTSEGQQSSSNLEIEVDYALHPCGNVECVELTRFDASIPAGSYAGLEVQSGKLSLVAVTAQPIMDATGRFDFPAGSLHFVLTADIANTRLSITRTNATITHGRVSHAADLFELTDLDLRYTGSGFGAELRLELAGSHTNRTPRAAIRRLDLPFDCDDPVVFEAASVDPDDDPMRHYWWTPNGMVDASSTEVVLSSGDHRIVLLSMDGRGAHDVTSLSFTRRCT